MSQVGRRNARSGREHESVKKLASMADFSESAFNVLKPPVQPITHGMVSLFAGTLIEDEIQICADSGPIAGHKVHPTK